MRADNKQTANSYKNDICVETQKLQQLQQQQQQQQQQQEHHHTALQQLNGCDNIITISTSSITNELSTPHAENQSATAATTKKPQLFAFHLPQFLSNTTTTTTTTTTAKTATIINKNKHKNNNTSDTHSNASTAAASATNLSNETCCLNAKRWVSFQENIADVHHRKGRRIHGLQFPLHPLQIFGWLVFLLFSFAAYYVLLPTFNSTLQGPLYGLITGLYIVHIISHITALLLDPADRELRRVHRNDRIVPEFDRSKHAHVIENGRCHLCNIRTSSPRTKHCSVCNKCVGKFDHHCKWLNHCIGSRNYVAFLMCVVSAVVATLVIVAAVVAQIVLYYVQPEWLNFWYLQGLEIHDAPNHREQLLLNSTIATTAAAITTTTTIPTPTETLLNGTESSLYADANITNSSYYLLSERSNDYIDMPEYTTLPSLLENFTTLLAEHANESTLYNLTNATLRPAAANTTATIAGISLNDTIFLGLLGVLGLLAAITAGLLLHLCFFHIYISFLGLTTYEYIRNHRQAQEAKAKLAGNPTLSNHSQPLTTTTNKKTNDCGQIYCCASLRHPNSIDPIDQHYFEAQKAITDATNHQTSSPSMKLHCCANSREYHQTALKTYYMCSLLEESSIPIPNPLHISHMGTDFSHESHEEESAAAAAASNNFSTFHCCSSFAATTTQRKVSAATTKATLVTDVEAATAALSARRSYLQYTEQCTLCTFRIRSPIVSKRKVSAAVSTRTQSTATALPNTNPTSATTQVTSTEHQRCCMKDISKNQRWRRKWNCCSSVPDSPDVPNDIIAALAMRHQHSSAASAKQKINAADLPVQFIKTVNGESNGGMQDTNGSRPTSPRSTSFKAQTRTRNARTWPVARLRHMVRMFNRYRQRDNATRCHHHHATATGGAVADQVKQNQIRPLQLQSQSKNSNGCYHNYHHHHHHHHHNHNDQQKDEEQQQHSHYTHCDYDSSPQPASTTTPSERSSEPSIYSDSSNLTTPCGVQPNTIETILPTSHICDDTSMTYTTPMGITLPPALPPPTRRKIPNPTDLEELAETLGFASHPSNGALTYTQRLPVLNNVYRRQRRKHFLRTRSPTLSPIHESGLSNPTSPQLCRHNASINCSPTGLRVNQQCTTGGSNEFSKKTASNSSLHSISSNSSST